MKLYLDIRNFTKARINPLQFKRVALKTLRTIGTKGKIEVSLAIVGEGRIKTLNEKYRGVDKVTDVLAFGRNFAINNRFVEPPDKIKRLGEVVICLKRAKIQAKSLGHSLKKELTLLFIHGILHLLGFRDDAKREKERMKKIQNKVLLKLTLNH